jgi:hypothetical protein
MGAISRVPGLCFATVIATLAFAAQPAQAQLLGGPGTTDVDYSRDVFFFGGRFQSGVFHDTFLFWNSTYEDNYFIGAGYQEFVASPGWGWHVGIELGLGLRVGTAEPSSFETWFGYLVRNDGFTLGDTFRISPALTAGVSATSGTTGIETVRAGWHNRDVRLLFYLGPEISVTYLPMPDFEAFFRIQHRSGLYGVMAPVDGSNAATFGIRYKMQ